MHHHVAAGQRFVDRALDQARRAVTLDHGLTRADRDVGVGEEAARRLAQPQPGQLDLRFEWRERLNRARAGLARRAVHQHVGVLGDQAQRRREDDRGDR
ncbi:MAG TPA: hypothetical protein VHU13_02490 [Solirubrobacteraceae bacterium]|nr:hypothetical protein [Solirubrobacteraceae bacterium]